MIYHFFKGNSNFELGTAICFIIVRKYTFTLHSILHIAVLSPKLEFPFFEPLLINITKLITFDCIVLYITNSNDIVEEKNIKLVS